MGWPTGCRVIASLLPPSGVLGGPWVSSQDTVGCTPHICKGNRVEVWSSPLVLPAVATEVALLDLHIVSGLVEILGGLGGETRLDMLDRRGGQRGTDTYCNQGKCSRRPKDDFRRVRATAWECADSWTWLHHAQRPRGGEARAGVGAIPATRKHLPAGISPTPALASPPLG